MSYPTAIGGSDTRRLQSGGNDYLLKTCKILKTRSSFDGSTPRTNCSELYSRKPTECHSCSRASASKGSQEACGNLIESGKPETCGETQLTSQQHFQEKKYQHRLSGGGNNATNECQNGCGNCITSKKYRPPSSKIIQPPPPCSRSHRRQKAVYQTLEPRQPEACGNTKGCSCTGSSGPDSCDNQDRQTQRGCCASNKPESLPCKCICQSCKSSQIQGGCGGQSCGKIYSCAGSGGKSCFPRNHRRRDGAECCNGSDSSNRGGCC